MVVHWLTLPWNQHAFMSNQCLNLCKQVDVHAMAHITGGGLPGNLPRVLPNGAQAVINESSWEWPELFKLLQREGGVEQFEMYRTFNCGVGMVVVVDAS